MSNRSLSSYTKLLEEANGIAPFKRLTDGQSTNEPAYAVKAMNGDVVFDTGCTAQTEDAPAEDDTITQGDYCFGDFTNVAIKTGVAYVYLITEEE